MKNLKMYSVIVLTMLLAVYSCTKQSGEILKDQATVFEEKPADNIPANKYGCVYDYKGITTINEFMSLANEEVYPFNLLTNDEKIRFANKLIFLKPVNCSKVILSFNDKEVFDKLTEEEYNHFIQAVFKFNAPSYGGTEYTMNPFNDSELSECDWLVNEKPVWINKTEGTYKCVPSSEDKCCSPGTAGPDGNGGSGTVVPAH